MRDNFSILKVAGAGAVGLLLLFLGREVPVSILTEVLYSDIQPENTNDEDVVVSNTFSSEWYPVEQVIDGDTLRVTVDNISESVRVLGINTPETEFSSRGAECFGAEAAQYAKTLLQGTQVRLELDTTQDTRDKYGRLLAYVIMTNSQDFGEKMIQDGYAYEYTYRGNSYKNQKLYKNAESRAKESKVGLWGERGCE